VDLIERLSGLMRADNRRLASQLGLQPVHLDLLRYLARCNRYSNTPAAITQYLGSTKGTVSQSIKVLETKGLVSKLADAEDKRVVRLKLLNKARRLLQGLDGAAAVQQAVDELGTRSRITLDQQIVQLLTTAQRINQNRTFGQCKTCRFLGGSALGQFQCGVTGEALTQAETELICFEHELPAKS
jgi:MarR family transcriptional repressor of emrRAB